METPVQPGADIEAGKAQDALALRDFLGSNPVHCPDCGYNVHGCDEARCPECAWPLSLQLKPRVSFVPFWLFSILINGWLFLWGLGGSVSTGLRAWQYHGNASRRFVASVTQAQSQALIQQFTGRSDDALAKGAVAGATVSLAPAPTSLIENLWTFFVGQNLFDQTSIALFLLGAIFGGTGLLMTPWMRRQSPRTNAWLMSASIAIFGLMMANYVSVYVSYLTRAF